VNFKNPHIININIDNIIYFYILIKLFNEVIYINDKIWDKIKIR